MKLKPVEVADDTNGYFDGVAYAGASTSQIAGFDGNSFIPESTLYGLMHEFVHTLGLVDGPPGLHTCCSDDTDDHRWCEERYYFGNLNIICQTYVDSTGLPPIPDPGFETIPWRTVVDFTGENKKDIPVYDVGDGGAIYKYSLGNYAGVGEERFLFTFRDDEQDAIPGRGLTVWHCVGNRVWDIESVIGLWGFADAETTDFHYPWDLGWGSGQEDAIQGYDNYDYWEWGDLPGEHRNRWHYGDHAGTPYDFLIPQNESLAHTQDTFAFNTNPNSKGYNPDSATNEFLRRRPQDQDNSLIVRVKDFDTDEFGRKFAKVDFLSAPYEDVLYPSGSAVFSVNQKVEVRWTNHFSGHINSVDVFLHPIAANEELYYSVGTAHIDAGDSTYTWTVTADQGTSGGRLRVRFHNPHSDKFSDEYSPGTFVVNSPPVKRERIITPNGGELLVSQQETEIQWTNAWGADITQVDLKYLLDGGAWQIWQNDISYTPGATNTFAWTPDNRVAGVPTRVGLAFHTMSTTAADSSDADFHVVPVLAKYTDVSETGIQDPWVGKPSSIASISYNADAKPDAFVGLGGDTGERGEVYRNDTEQDELSLIDRTFDAFSPVPAVGSSAVTAADFDNDGDEDLLVCRPGGENLKLYRLAGASYTSDTSVFANLQDQRVLQYVQCATWVDFDHDGDLDLYLGRGDEETAKADGLLEYNSSTGTFYDVAAATGFEPGPTYGSTTSAAWADFDSDGLWDIVRTTNAKAGLSTQRLRQTGPDSTFEVVASGLPSSISPDENSQVQWVDVDRDNDLDLLFISEGGLGQGLATARVCHNEDGTFAEPELIASITSSGVLCPYDYDLDGWQDFLASGGTSAQLIANLQGLSEVYPDYLDVSTAAGLGTGGSIGSVLATDLNRDGDLDVVLGRLRIAQAPKVGLVMASQQPDSTEAPASHWVGLRLKAAVGYTPFGATVALSTPTGEPLGVQVVDGGGSGEFQRGRDLVFGLGEYDGAVNVEIHWPHWASSDAMEFTLAASQIDAYTTIEEFTSFTISSASVSYQLLWDPYLESFDWIFRWNTNHWTQREQDHVNLSLYSGSNCESMPVTLQDTGTETVKTTVTYEGGVFKHELRWHGRDCFVGCTYSYSVQSAIGQNPPTTVYGRTRITFSNCPSQ